MKKLILFGTLLVLCISALSGCGTKENDSEPPRAMTEEMNDLKESTYRFSKETIDSINLKCHDMRHQIREIGEHAHM